MSDQIVMIACSRSVNNALRTFKAVYALPWVPGVSHNNASTDWLRIDRYKVKRGTCLVPMGRSLATGKWFVIDGANVEVR